MQVLFASSMVVDIWDLLYPLPLLAGIVEVHFGTCDLRAFYLFLVRSILGRKLTRIHFIR